MLSLPGFPRLPQSEAPVGFAADLAQARHEALVSQLPLLHLILCVNTVALSFTYATVAPAWLAVYLPAGLIAFCAIRLAMWIRRSRAQVAPAKAASALRAAHMVAAILGVSFMAWTVALYGYGDALLRSQLIYTVGITNMCAIFSLMQAPRAALGVAALILPGFLIEMFLYGEAYAIFVVLCLLLVSISVAYMVAGAARNFETMVRAKRQADQLAAENRRLANTDSLTGLANRREFFARLDEAIRNEGPEGALVMALIDLDGFKPVNDLYGHAVGDAVLRECAARIEDYSCEGATVARLGGDEFGVILRGAMTEEQVIGFGGQLCAALKSPTHVDAIEARVSASVGFARYPQDALEAALLYERADFALYVCKDSQRGQAVLFSPEHALCMRMSAEIEQALRRADLDKELSLDYQPLFNIADRSIVAFEALARWNSPTLGAVAPQDFIPIAENNELIHTITRTVLRKALNEARNWPAHVNLSLNLSIRDLLSPTALTRIIALIASSGFDPARIDLEVTETALLTDFVRAEAAILDLKRLGVKISLDDFGTGYSSLAYVHRLPLDKIKIDRSFIQQLFENGVARDIVKSMIDLCARLGVQCVSEGVETAEQLDILAAFGCSVVQGFLFSRPIAEKDVPCFIAHAERAAGRLSA